MRTWNGVSKNMERDQQEHEMGSIRTWNGLSENMEWNQ